MPRIFSSLKNNRGARAALATGACLLLLGRDARAAEAPPEVSPEAPASPVAVVPAPPAAVPPAPIPDSLMEPAYAASPWALANWHIDASGYIHAAYRWIQQPQNYNLAGRNNGFQLEQARVVASVAWKRWLFLRISVEGASEDRLGQSFPGGQITARLRDAYLSFSPLRALRLTVGQMVTPWDLDSMRSDAELPFVSRSVTAEGVQPSEGYTTRGLGADRNLGLSLHSGFIPIPGALSLRYAAFIGNSNGQNQLLSDNNLPALYGRVEFAYWGRRALPPDRPGPLYAISDLFEQPIVSIGVAGQWRPRTSGNLPDLIRETDSGAAADLAASLFGVELQAGLIYLRTAHNTLTAVPDQERFGYWAHLRYTLPRIPPQITLGYRIASYAPRAHLSVEAATPADARIDGSLGLLYHTLGVFARPLRGFPLHVGLNYTFTTEQAPNQLDNDRFEADVVAVF